jgi:hypothetical protein
MKVVPQKEFAHESTSAFHCGTEVHLWKKHRLSLPIYLLALRLSKQSGRFVAHIERLTQHFDSSRSAVWRAITDLKRSQFFVLARSGGHDFESSEYIVLTHRDWADRHPNECREKFELGYGDRAACDLLGRRLYALSGSYEIKFQTFRLDWYRKLGFSDRDIENVFADWFPGFARERQVNGTGKRWRRYVDYEFGEYLADVAEDDRDGGITESQKLRRRDVPEIETHSVPVLRATASRRAG